MRRDTHPGRDTAAILGDERLVDSEAMKIIIAAMTLVIGSLLIPETKDRNINN